MRRAGVSHLTLTTADGIDLEATLDRADEAVAGIVLCHPHPRHGGTMRHPLLGAITRRAVAAGIDVLRFNFRGVGESTGAPGDGVLEERDITAAVSWMDDRSIPLIGIAGWSFGAATALAWQAATRSTIRYAGVAPPVRGGLTPDLPPPDELAPARRTFIVGARDQFVDADELAAYAADIGAAIVRYDTADHFFLMRYDRLAGEVVGALAD